MAADPRARVFVIFLDTYHTQIEGSPNMRLPLVRFLDRVLGPDDLVAVMTPEMSASRHHPRAQDDRHLQHDAGRLELGPPRPARSTTTRRRSSTRRATRRRSGRTTSPRR